ncbi:hypothetical protein RJT34_17992 [Clitoria ternatea]|uniref:Uncharacterized protein n=1 Tax=Clitoria ternatea TaxID=43366 RepID=A0AAN9JD31_CLITE
MHTVLVSFIDSVMQKSCGFLNLDLRFDCAGASGVEFSAFSVEPELVKTKQGYELEVVQDYTCEEFCVNIDNIRPRLPC